MQRNQKDCKLLRDPIYGYISIPDFIFDTVIDTAPFQRLRCIRQTSYEPLYSAALHNRFTHSIGVYHLGCIAFESFKKSADSLNLIKEQEWDRLWHVFTLACLLHDVGHAPFSHTGEDAFNDSEPEKSLMGEINSEDFTRDVNNGSAAPHEYMSAYLALKTFPEIFELENNGEAPEESAEEKAERIGKEKELFARCIIGHPYDTVPMEKGVQLKNCLISLLNSKTIDVDRLDYVIRDSYVSGFQNMSIDYERLLSSVCIAERDGYYHLAYHKNALSIIENVTFAYDAEKKWIQSHPVVLYEHFLIQHAIEVVKKYYGDLREDRSQPGLFTYESLSKEGNKFSENLNISLLSDDDIIYSIKNIPECRTELTEEYFARTDRRHAVWKSEAEFRALFEQILGPLTLDEMETFFQQLDTRLIKLTGREGQHIINDDFLDDCRKDFQQLESNLLSDSLSEKDANDVRIFLRQAIPILEAMKKYMEDNGLRFDFVYVPAKQFHSTFRKGEIKKILIYYPKFKRAYYISEVSTILDGDTSDREKFFYLFYQRKTLNGEKTDQKIDALSFSKLLCRHFIGDAS